MSMHGRSVPRERSRGHLTGRRLLAVVATAVLAGGVLSGCTTTARNPDVPTTAGPSAPASATSSRTGTSSTAPDGQTGSGSAPTGSGSGGQPSSGGPATTSPGTADTSPQIPPVTYQTDPVQAAVEKVLPGMYGLDSLGATVSGSAVRISAPVGCGFVMEVLDAGQWTVTDLVKPTATSKSYTAVLTRGDRAAILSLTDSGSVCQGSIVAPVQASLTLTGALTANGAASLYPLSCPSGGGTDPVPMYAVYTTAAATYLVVLGVVPATGTHTAKGSDESGDATAMLYQSAAKADLGSATKALSQLMAATSASPSASGDAGDSSDQIPAGWNAKTMFTTVDASTVSSAVTSTAPLRATVTATKLTNPSAASSTLSLTATLTCGG